MTEQAKSNGWRAILAGFMLLLRPALLLGAGILLIVTLGVAQRLGWIESDGGGQAQPQAAAKPGGTLYVCPMMCTPPLSEPGRCPVCGMELRPTSAGGSGGDARAITIDPATRRVANIQTAPVQSKAVTRPIRAVGRISYDEGKLKMLAAYVDGRIDRLYADYTGVIVSRGDELALLYSPELYAAQSELLAAQRAARDTKSPLYAGTLSSQDLAASARQKLLDLGMTPRQIEQLERTGRPETRIKLVAPIHGTVIDRLAAEGEYVKTGQAIYRLADLSTVWLMLELFPEHAAAVRYGQRVQAQVESLPGETFAGRVAFIDPTVDPRTRTIGVRVVLKNEDGRLKVGDYATARIKAPVVTGRQTADLIYDPELAGKWVSPRHPHVIEDGPGQCKVCGIDLVPASRLGFTSEPVADRKELVVPRSAVLMAGDHSVVYVETEPGRFELRQVALGPGVGEEIVLLDGVQAGEEVATNGNFLIDSQMQLSGKPSLIDPAKAQTSQEESQDATIDAALARLSEEDRRLARLQRICPVSKAPLGSMGPPKKVQVDGRSVFICCEGCRKPLLDDPDKYLAVLEAAKKRRQKPSEENKPPEAPNEREVSP